MKAAVINICILLMDQMTVGNVKGVTCPTTVTPHSVILWETMSHVILQLIFSWILSAQNNLRVVA